MEPNPHQTSGWQFVEKELVNPMSDLYTLQDPTRQYPQSKFKRPDAESAGARQEDGARSLTMARQVIAGAGGCRTGRRLVTGGDSGIGRAAAIAFAREGADVATSVPTKSRAIRGEISDFRVVSRAKRIQ